MQWRVARVTAVVAVAAVLLTSCTVPFYGGVRLNADGSIDYVVCDRDEQRIDVDYRTGLSEVGESEWTASVRPAARDAEDPVVIHYGELPRGWVQAAPAADPPRGWTWVNTPGGSFERDDLYVGEWAWNVPTTWEWIPDHICAGYEIGHDGDPQLEGS